jgi:hypothetical protein
MPDFFGRKWTVILWGKSINTFQLKKRIGDWVASGNKETSNCLAIVL